MENNYEKMNQLQDAYLDEVFSSISEKQINLIVERVLAEYVQSEALDKNDLADIKHVLESKSKNSFYDLETHPREILWGLLNQVVKPFQSGFSTIKTVAERVTFLGWLENSTHPVFQSVDKKLYRADNEEILNIEVGAEGKIVFKANAIGGKFYFEPHTNKD